MGDRSKWTIAESFCNWYGFFLSMYIPYRWYCSSFTSQCFLRNLEGPGPYSEYIKSNKKEKEKEIEVTNQETKKETKKIKRYLLYTRVCVLHHSVVIIFLGVPSLKRSELETACEDFSNIIGSTSTCMLYKGTLSSGVEIAVASSLVTSAKDWSKENESQYRKKVSYSYLQSARYTTFLILIDENDNCFR